MDPVPYKSLIFPTGISSVRTNWAVQTVAEVTARAKPNAVRIFILGFAFQTANHGRASGQ
jgi:hypothetical protein